MKPSTMNGLSRTLASYAAVLLLAMPVLTMFVPAAYGQQEVDPSWYNPWLEARHADAHPSQTGAVHAPNQHKSATHRAKNKKQVCARCPGDATHRRNLPPSKHSRFNPNSSRILQLLPAYKKY